MLKKIKTEILIICLVALILTVYTIKHVIQLQRLSKLTVQLNELIPELLRKYGVPGTAIAIIHNGKIDWIKGYGKADKSNDISVTPDTVFQAASISKSVTAWGVMRLVEQGKLELDSPVEQYLTRWHLPPSYFDHSGVTIRHLLNHTAGLSLNGYPGFNPDQPLPTLEESLSGVTNGAGDVRMEQQPGLEFSYSGGGYTLLQLVVEEVSGKTFADYMQQEILKPLGMVNSSFESKKISNVRSITATPYDVDGMPLPYYHFTAKSAAGLCTTVYDLARFVAAGMSGPEGKSTVQNVLTPDTVKMMFSTTVLLKVDDGLGYEAYGLGYATEVLSNGTRIIAHTGSNRGWRSHFAALPEKGEGIVILTNSDMGNNLIIDVLCLWVALTAKDTPQICQY